MLKLRPIFGNFDHNSFIYKQGSQHIRNQHRKLTMERRVLISKIDDHMWCK